MTLRHGIATDGGERPAQHSTKPGILTAGRREKSYSAIVSNLPGAVSPTRLWPSILVLARVALLKQHLRRRQLFTQVSNSRLIPLPPLLPLERPSYFGRER